MHYLAQNGLPAQIIPNLATPKTKAENVGNLAKTVFGDMGLRLFRSQFFLQSPIKKLGILENFFANYQQSVKATSITRKLNPIQLQG